MPDTNSENEKIDYISENEIYAHKFNDIPPNRIVDSCIYVAWVKDPDLFKIGITNNKNNITYILRENEHFKESKILYTVFIFESFLEEALIKLKNWYNDNNLAYYDTTIDPTNSLLTIRNYVEFQQLKTMMNTVGEIYYLKLKHNLNELQIMQKKLDYTVEQVDRLEKIIDTFLDKNTIIR